MLVDKINKISKINEAIDYLMGEYKLVQMSAYVPDGELRFEKLMEWLSNEHNAFLVEDMIKTVKEIKAL